MLTPKRFFILFSLWLSKTEQQAICHLRVGKVEIVLFGWFGFGFGLAYRETGNRETLLNYEVENRNSDNIKE